jgi:hypothetical protein
MTHSERLDNFTQYLWGDILEEQMLSSELVELLRDAGQKIEKAEKLLINGSDTKFNKEVMSEHVLISNELAKDLLKMINSEIRQCEDNPMYRGKAPDSLYEMRDELEKAKEI